jgi:hypothetical protein
VASRGAAKLLSLLLVQLLCYFLTNRGVSEVPQAVSLMKKDPARRLPADTDSVRRDRETRV